MERALQTLVIDTSAVTKWFVEEADVEKATTLRDAHLKRGVTLTAPDQLIYEVANALNYRPKVSEHHLTTSVRSLLEFELDLVPPTVEYSSHTAEVARRLSISVYDASYVALSDMIATNLVTADRRLYEKLSGKTQVPRTGAQSRQRSRGNLTRGRPMRGGTCLWL